jgi:diguanylate cyclase (GGDEF)-like protein
MMQHLPTIKDIANKEFFIINHSTSIYDAARMLKTHNIEMLIIRHPDEAYSLFTARDLLSVTVDELNMYEPIDSYRSEEIITINQDTEIYQALHAIDKDSEYMGVVDDLGRLTGVISCTDLISNIDPKQAIETQKISSLFSTTKIPTTEHDAKTIDVIKQMQLEGHDSLLVEKKEKPVGILTTKDFVRLISEHSDFDKPISAYMSKPLININEDDSVKEALGFVQQNQFKRVIVLDTFGKAKGMLSKQTLITTVYNQWLASIREHQEDLSKLNKTLQDRLVKYEMLATTDYLTQVYNRSKFEDIVAMEISRSSRYKTGTFSLIFFDIDHFKEINDTHGHAKGDEVLKELADFVDMKIRKTDVLARWGGEEFMILLPHTDLEHALKAAEKVRSSLGNSKLCGLKITASFGVATHIKNEKFEHMLERLDEALYKAKNAGRNKIAVAMH